MKQLVVVAGCAALLTACSKSPETTADGPNTAAPAAKVAVRDLPKVEAPAILEHIKVLADDSFEGRAPGTPGEDKTVEYLTAKFKEIGLAPGNTDGTYVQKVPLVGITPAPAQTLTIQKGGQKRTFAWSKDYVAFTKHVADTAALQNS